MSSERDLTAVEAEFEIVDRTDEPYDERAGAPTLFRQIITKRYRGVIDGDGVAHVLVAGGEDGGGYVASERVVGALDGRTGTFVIQHAGLADGTAQTTSGAIVPGSGTGDLAGISGTAEERRMGVLTLRYALPDADA